MVRKISLLLLLFTLFVFAFSMTSCESTGEEVGGFFTSILPDKESSEIAKVAHDIVDWMTQQFKTFFKFEWAKKAWNWVDDTFKITEKVNQTKEAWALIKTGNFNNIIEGITTIFGCGIILVIGAALALVAILIAVVVDLVAEALLVVLLVVLGIAVFVLAIIGFVVAVLPNIG
jgi:hypothetical protein